MFRLLPLLLAFAVPLLASCSLMDTHKEAEDGAETVRKGPNQPARFNATNFSEALGCMDRLMVTHQIRDASFVIEDLADNTGKVKAGTRDMVISAVSEMTRRSRAILLNAYGVDTGNIIGLLERAQRRNAYAVVPQFDLRGSVTQLDDLSKAQADVGAFVDPKAGIGYSKSTNVSVLALDLSVVDTNTLNVISGIVSKNTVVLFKDGKGLDAEATYNKLGINFSMNFSVNDGQGQALRNLIELGTVELMGRLFKLPYWTCLKIDPNSPEVLREVEDWYFATEAHGELTAFVKNRLQLRGYYKGAVDDKVDSPLVQSVVSYKRAQGLNANGEFDLDLFKRLLSFPAAKAVASTTPTVGAAKPLGLEIDLSTPTGQLSKGGLFEIVVRNSTDAYVYCFYQDDSGSIQRFYPNRFSKDSFMTGGAALRLPGNLPFKFHASKRGIAERVACYAAEQDVLSQVETLRRSQDFEPIKAASLKDIGASLRLVSQQRLAEKEILIRVQ
jgi:hypothetical protein